MRDAVALPVTVKHRIGIDAVEDYAFVRDFVGTVAARGLRRVPRARAQRGPEGPRRRRRTARCRRSSYEYVPPAEARLSRS